MTNEQMRMIRNKLDQGTPLNYGEQLDLQALLFSLEKAAQQAQPVQQPPLSSWDEWALHRASDAVRKMNDVIRPGAELVAQIQCLLIDAMRFAAPDAQPVQQEPK